MPWRWMKFRTLLMLGISPPLRPFGDCTSIRFIRSPLLLRNFLSILKVSKLPYLKMARQKLCWKGEYQTPSWLLTLSSIKPVYKLGMFFILMFPPSSLVIKRTKNGISEKEDLQLVAFQLIPSVLTRVKDIIWGCCCTIKLVLLALKTSVQLMEPFIHLFVLLAVH